MSSLQTKKTRQPCDTVIDMEGMLFLAPCTIPDRVHSKVNGLRLLNLVIIQLGYHNLKELH